MFDVIVVGARCAGSPLAMLLARKGYRVLVADKATFPSEYIATHMVWPPGGAALKRWGIWEAVVAANPAICHVSYSSFHPYGDLRTPWPATDGVDWTFNLRRVKLDDLLVQAARSSGAEVREGVLVEDLSFDDRGQVVGIQARELKTGLQFRERARLVVGADGKRSLVARRVQAPMYHVVEPVTASYLVYMADLDKDRDVNEVHTRPPYEFLLLPTDDGLTVVNLVIARHLLDDFRKDVERNFYAAWDNVPELAEKVRAARPVSRILGMVDLPNFFRKPYGPGWALVGDAGLTRDPIRAQGMHNAFVDAELLAVAIDDGFGVRCPLDAALAAYQRARDEQNDFPYKLCISAARLEPLRAEAIRALLDRIGHDPVKGAKFRGLYDGSVKPEEFFGPRSGTPSSLQEEVIAT